MRIFGHLAIVVCTLAACDTNPTETAISDVALTAPRPPRTREHTALEALRARSSVPAEVHIVDGYPHAVTGRWSTPSNMPFVDRARAFLLTYDDLFHATGDGLTLVVERVLPDTEGVVFRQLWRGTPVVGAEITVLFQRTSIIGTRGSLATEPLTLARSM